MSDRTDPNQDGDDEIAPVSIDAAGIDILGTQTAQVAVTFPVERVEDDLVLDDLDGPIPGAPDAEESDDDPVVPEPVRVAGLPDGEAEAEADVPVAHAELEAEAEPEVDPEVETAPAGPVEDIADAEVVVETAPAAPARPAPAEPAPAAAPAAASEPTTAPSPKTSAVPTTTGALRRRPESAPVTLAAKRVGERDAQRESADLLTDDRLVEPGRLPKPDPQGLWPHLLYTLSGRRLNIGDSRRSRERKALSARIAAPLPGGARFVAVLSRKGGVGKTTVTTLLGMALADAREDRVIAVDANPDRGTLADRVGGSGGKTVRDLSRSRIEIGGFNEFSAVVARDATRLDVLASDADPRVSDAFSDEDYRDVAELAAHYYSIVLTDTGTGIVHSVMDATLDAADAIVIVTGLSVDEARLASETLTWLETNGYGELARDAVVVLNTSRPGAPMVRADQLEEHFRTRVRTVLRVPYDPTIATGGAIAFHELAAPTRESARRLAASVVEGLHPQAVPAA